MPATRTLERPGHSPTNVELARGVRAECERAMRRLNVLIRERDDVLLAQALDSVRRAAALSARQAERTA